MIDLNIHRRNLPAMLRTTVRGKHWQTSIMIRKQHCQVMLATLQANHIP
jgi:hypothetical protein